MATPATSSGAATATEDDDEEYFEEDEDVVEPGDDSGVKCCADCKCESYTRRQLRQLAPTEGHHMLMVYMGNMQQICYKRHTNNKNKIILSRTRTQGRQGYGERTQGSDLPGAKGTEEPGEADGGGGDGRKG